MQKWSRQGRRVDKKCSMRDFVHVCYAAWQAHFSQRGPQAEEPSPCYRCVLRAEPVSRRLLVASATTGECRRPRQAGSAVCVDVIAPGQTKG